jgi:hypothetical protein
MEGETFHAAMEREGVTMEDLEAIDAERARKSEEENRAAAEKRAEEEKASEEKTYSDAEREMFASLGISLEDKTPPGESAKADQPADGEKNEKSE